jgi:hypothetical protein
MKQFISPRLGAASVLALFTFAAIHLSSCGGSNPKEDGGLPEIVSGHHPILIAYDSSLGGGSGPGLHPSVVLGHPTLTISCPNIDCSPMTLNSYKPGTTGADSVAYVIEATTSGAIAAKTILRFEIRMKKDTAAPMVSGAMKK